MLDLSKIGQMRCIRTWKMYQTARQQICWYLCEVIDINTESLELPNFLYHLYFNFYRFLRGACEKKDCLLSHKTTLSKMPTCKFYLLGLCTKDDCPYLHRKVTEQTEICSDFLNGYCEKAEEVCTCFFYRLFIKHTMDVFPPISLIAMLKRSILSIIIFLFLFFW